jgi:hypothetical protein
MRHIVRRPCASTDLDLRQFRLKARSMFNCVSHVRYLRTDCNIGSNVLRHNCSATGSTANLRVSWDILAIDLSIDDRKSGCGQVVESHMYAALRNSTATRRGTYMTSKAINSTKARYSYAADHVLRTLTQGLGKPLLEPGSTQPLNLQLPRSTPPRY